MPDSSLSTRLLSMAIPADSSCKAEQSECPESVPIVTGRPIPRIEYFTTLRGRGFSQGDFAGFNFGLHTEDDAECVSANRRALASALGCRIAWLEQVHGTAVADADLPDWGCPLNPRGEAIADACITSRNDIAPAVMTADCLPILLATQDRSVVGAVHGGWRSLAGGILRKTAALMHKKANSPVDVGWIGPGISQQAFEVGPEVREKFLSEEPALDRCFRSAGQHSDRFYGDLAAIAAAQLQALGVADIGWYAGCTWQEADSFYSYRRQARTGRMVSLIRKRPYA